MCLIFKGTKTITTAFNSEATAVGYNIKGCGTLEYISVPLFRENNN